MRPGYAADDSVALHFVGTELARVVASRPGRRGWRLDVAGGEVVEEPLDTVELGATVALAGA